MGVGWEMGERGVRGGCGIRVGIWMGLGWEWSVSGVGIGWEWGVIGVGVG